MPLDPDLIAAIRAGAVQRDRDRELPHEQIRALLDAGFGSARVPQDDGGEGIAVVELVERLIEVAAADANVAHVFRGHLAVVEQQFFEPDAERRARWIRRILDGELIGNAQSEVGGTADLSTTLTETPDGLRLDGRKYYTTGSIYADWIDLSARYRGEDHQVLVSTHQDGVTSIDDWKGFGQRLTGSGTTTFTAALVEEREVRPYSADDDGFRHPYLMGFFQLVLLAVVAGIGRAALHDAVEYVRPRRRIFGYAGEALPRENALVQSVIGRLSSSAHAAEAITLHAARSLDTALDGLRRGHGDPERFTQAQLDVYRAQQTVLPLVIDAASELFEVGGASAVDRDAALDRHWRNARTIATHNPAVHRSRAIGVWELDGTAPEWSIPVVTKATGA
ncbi:acyl-CoA dehydrogenase family protein [Homoserinibacter sp. YIM 151385]|uniref:acyl-CoA dehydrogenase family protein n=1 Tax=Homoserinibacter sp. YIM 151385 TaxID=2985506 RepID=UPI0022F0BEF2|nr:acyl-CoA dehydrogenase family protein [Homoserinibacter sp. YIM 151385]WBU36966.1 acyl-CoA dehydrogenase family protein [Homoserinibacter sp. YIM 151385]